MDEISLDNESDAEPIPMDMLGKIRYRIQYHSNITRRETCYKIHYCIKQRQAEWKGALLSTLNMGKGSHKVSKAIVN